MEEKKQGGYGFVSKDVLLDPEIPVEAKALYAYLCAHADKAGKCFPSVDGICRHLKITEKRFRKYKTVLVESGIIEVKREKKGNCWGQNIYYIQDDLRTGSFGSIQNDRVDTDDSDGFKIGGSRNGRVEIGCVESNRINSTTATVPVKENHGDKHTQSNTGLCTQVCDLLNHRRSDLRSKGRIKVNSLSQGVVKRLLGKGMTESDILEACQEFCVVTMTDWRVTFGEFEDYCDSK